jgi:N-acetylmuramoyl-L-alanine amidase
METRHAYDQVLWALAVWREARGEPYKTKLGVAYVIRNRMLDKAGRWPGTVVGVILQRQQFSAFNVDDPNAAKLPVPGDASWDDSCRAVDECMTSAAADPTGGANHYHALPASKSSTWPAWAEVSKQTAIFGSTRFYRR